MSNVIAIALLLQRSDKRLHMVRNAVRRFKTGQVSNTAQRLKTRVWEGGGSVTGAVLNMRKVEVARQHKRRYGDLA